MTAPLNASVAAPRLARACAAIAIMLALLPLVGWVTRTRALTTFLPGHPVMMPITIFVLIVAAFAVIVLAKTDESRALRNIVGACGLLVLTAGVEVLIEYLVGAQTWIDRLIDAAPPPGRPSPLAAVAFALLGVSFLACSIVSAARVSRAAAIAAGYVGLVTMTGHAFGASSLYRLGTTEVIGVALPASIAILAVAIGILSSDPTAVRVFGGDERPWPGSTIRRRLGLLILAVPVVVGVLIRLLQWLGLRDPVLATAIVASSSVPVGAAIVIATGRELDRAQRSLRIAFRAERRLRGEMEALGRASLVVSEAVAALPQSDLITLLHTVVLQARSLTNARYGALGVLGDVDAPFDPWVHSGVTPEQAAAIGRSPGPTGLLGRVARQGETLRIERIADAPGFRGLPPGHPPMSSFLGVPIRYHGQIVGSLYLTDKQGAAEFSYDDERAVESLAVRAAAALEAARAYGTEVTQRNWLQTVIDQMPEGVIETDRAARITMMNASMRAFALDEADPDAIGEALYATGATWTFDARAPNGHALTWDELLALLAQRQGDSIVGVELILRRRDGRRIPMLVNAGPIEDERGHRASTVTVFRDVSLLKQLERLREEWTSVVAHDLRQPVSVIALSIEMLRRRGPDAPPADALLERIGRSAHRLDRMIGDLLDASRIESRRLSLKPRRLVIATWLSATIEAVRDVIGRPIDLRIDANVDDVFADPDRIEQVLVNLLTNADKYGIPGSPIGVEVRPGDDGVVFAVTNRGVGLTRAERERVFTRFYRAEDVGSAPGLGLGLYIAKGLIEAHGGLIEVDSTPGATTEFRFTLPACAEPPSPHEDARRSSEAVLPA